MLSLQPDDTAVFFLSNQFHRQQKPEDIPPKGKGGVVPVIHGASLLSSASYQG